MANGTAGLADFKTFAKAEEKRAQAFADSQANVKVCYWYADTELNFNRNSMWEFFDKTGGKTQTGSEEVLANKRAADTVAAFDRAYKFRRQARLDNVPRQTCVANMDVYYWQIIYDALKAMTETAKPGG